MSKELLEFEITIPLVRFETYSVLAYDKKDAKRILKNALPAREAMKNIRYSAMGKVIAIMDGTRFLRESTYDLKIGISSWWKVKEMK